MIIVKTTNGDQFINDATVNRVAHNRETHTVTIHKGTVGTFEYAEHTIEHVEGVIYTNEAQAAQWKDEGSTIKKMQDVIDRQKRSFASIRQLEAKLKEAERMKEAYRQGSERLYERNLWQRIVNECVNLPMPLL